MLESSAPAFHDCTDHVPDCPLLKAVDARLVCLAITWVQCDDQLHGAASHEAEGCAVRGAAAPAVWGRRRAGTACACCARYSTSWSPASSNSCSLMMFIAVEDGAALVPGQEHGDALGTFARIRLRAAVRRQS